MDFKIYFRAFELSDSDFISGLRKIDEFENLIGGNKRFVSSQRDQKWVEDLILKDHQDKFYVSVCDKNTNDMIGYTSVSDIDHVNKSCFWSGIKIHPDYNGRGYGKQTVLLILRFVFEELNMERCTGRCLEEHLVAKNLMGKVGFQIEGLQRHSVFKNAKYHNEYVLSILKEDYSAIKSAYNI